MPRFAQLHHFAARYYGDVAYRPVREGNLMALACAFFAELAELRNLQIGLENPPGSRLWHFPPLANVLNPLCTQTCLVHRCAYDTAMRGQRIRKVYRFAATGQWVESVAATCPCGGKPHLHLTKQPGTVYSGLYSFALVS